MIKRVVVWGLEVELSTWNKQTKEQIKKKQQLILMPHRHELKPQIGELLCDLEETIQSEPQVSPLVK